MRLFSLEVHGYCSSCPGTVQVTCENYPLQLLVACDGKKSSTFGGLLHSTRPHFGSLKNSTDAVGIEIYCK